MYLEQLINFGLTRTQAMVLDFLLENGQKKAMEIARLTKQPRGVVYKALEELVRKNLVDKLDKEKSVAQFRAGHPRTLEKLFQERELRLKQDKGAFEELFPGLLSMYNLAQNKPRIWFYEGAEGIEKVLNDTLTSQTEVCLLINTAALAGDDYFEKINEEYKKKRMAAKVKKKILRVGLRPPIQVSSQKSEYQQITEIRHLNQEVPGFKANVHIYDQKVSFSIIDQNKYIGVLVKDRNIFQLQKTMFDLLWDLAGEVAEKV